MKKGSYKIRLTEPTQIDAVGFQARRKGLEVRDCLLILEPGNKSKLGLLTRSHLEGTVHEEWVRNENGVLDIDVSRIHMDASDIAVIDAKSSKNPREALNPIYGKYEKAIATPAHRNGRWPANLIIRHGKDCECVGTKKVGSGPEGGYTYAKNTYDVKGFVPSCKPQSPSNRGKEEVAVWHCQQECPAAVMDAQSGVLKSGEVSPHHMRNNTKNGGGGYHGKFGDTSLMGYGDEGGASRFFYQSKTKHDLYKYLERLVRGSIYEDSNE